MLKYIVYVDDDRCEFIGCGSLKYHTDIIIEHVRRILKDDSIDSENICGIDFEEVDLTKQ